MKSRAKILGHPVHPMLVVFPLGLLLTSLVFDVIHAKTKKREAATIANAMIGAGVLGGLLAAIPGIIDWLAIPARTRAKQIGAVHGGGNVLVLALFALSWMQRRDDPENPPSAARGLSIAGAALGGLTAWLGGELVYRLRVGVDDDAHLDASNSLLSKE